MAVFQAIPTVPSTAGVQVQGRLGTYGMRVGGLRYQKPYLGQSAGASHFRALTWPCGSAHLGLVIRTIIETQSYCAQPRFPGQLQTLPTGSAVDETLLKLPMGGVHTRGIPGQLAQLGLERWLSG